MNQVIINADDFGINSSANAAIADLYRKKALSSATIMINMGHSSTEAVTAAKLLNIPVGLHFNLTLNQKKYPNRSSFEKDYITGKMDKTYVLNELNRQYSALMAAGLRPTHLDSHQHIHNWPGIFRIAADFAKEKMIALRIPAEIPIFNPYEKIKLSDLKQLVRKLIFVFFSKMNKIYAQKIGVKTNQNLVSVFALWPRPAELTEKHLELIINKCRDKTEYMCHPAAAQQNMSGLTSIGKTSEEEYVLMTKNSFLDMIKKNNIELINFGGL